MRVYLKDHFGWRMWKEQIERTVRRYGSCEVSRLAFPSRLLGDEFELAITNLALIADGHRPDDSPVFDNNTQLLAWMARQMGCVFMVKPDTGNVLFYAGKQGD